MTVTGPSGQGMDLCSPDAAVRVGHDPQVILKQMHRYAASKYPNGFMKGNPHGIENFSTVPNPTPVSTIRISVLAGALAVCSASALADVVFNVEKTIISDTVEQADDYIFDR